MKRCIFMALQCFLRDRKRFTTQQHNNRKRDLSAQADNTSSPSFYQVIKVKNHIIQYYICQISPSIKERSFIHQKFANYQHTKNSRIFLAYHPLILWRNQQLLLTIILSSHHSKKLHHSILHFFDLSQHQREQFHTSKIRELSAY